MPHATYLLLCSLPSLPLPLDLYSPTLPLSSLPHQHQYSVLKALCTAFLPIFHSHATFNLVLCLPFLFHLLSILLLYHCHLYIFTTLASVLYIYTFLPIFHSQPILRSSRWCVVVIVVVFPLSSLFTGHKVSCFGVAGGVCVVRPFIPPPLPPFPRRQGFVTWDEV